MKKSVTILIFFFIFLIFFFGKNVLGETCTGSETNSCMNYDGDSVGCLNHYRDNGGGNYFQCVYNSPPNCVMGGVSCTLASCTDSDGDKYNQSAVGCGVADCNDANVSVWQNLNGYIDNDQDTYTTGIMISVCT